MTAEEHAEAAGAQPIPVRIGHDVTVQVGHDVGVQGQAADFGSWFTYTTPAGADTVRQILLLDRQRHRAVIIISALLGASLPAGGGVWVGTQAQCQANPPVGGFLPASNGSFVIENNQPLWMTGDGANALKVTVLQERWES